MFDPVLFISVDNCGKVVDNRGFQWKSAPHSAFLRMFTGLYLAENRDSGAYIRTWFQSGSLEEGGSHKELAGINVISTMTSGRIIY